MRTVNTHSIFKPHIHIFGYSFIVYSSKYLYTKRCRFLNIKFQLKIQEKKTRYNEFFVIVTGTYSVPKHLFQVNKISRTGSTIFHCQKRTNSVRYGGGIVSTAQDTTHSPHSVCFAHQAVLKSIAVNLRKPKGKSLKYCHSFVKLRWLYNLSSPTTR